MSFEKDEGPIGGRPEPLFRFGGLNRVDNNMEALLGRGLHRVHRDAKQSLASYKVAPASGSDEIERFISELIGGVSTLFLELFKAIFGSPAFLGFLVTVGAVAATYFTGDRNSLETWAGIGIEVCACLVYLIAKLSYWKHGRRGGEGELGAEGMIRFVRFLLLPVSGVFFAFTGRPLIAFALYTQAAALFLLTESQKPLREISPTPPREDRGLTGLSFLRRRRAAESPVGEEIE